MFTRRMISFAIFWAVPILSQAESNLTTLNKAKIELNLKPYVRQLSQEEKNGVEDVLASSQVKAKAAHAGNKPPTWSFTTGSNVDKEVYSNVLIGGDPQAGGSTEADVVIIPVTLKFHKMAKSIDWSTEEYDVINKSSQINMTSPDHCFSAPNNVPLTLVRQSPLFKPTDIRFGDTVLKQSQYIDAHQRATFWKYTGQDKNGYHLGLTPTFLRSLEINVPASAGLSVDSKIIYGNQVCGQIAQVKLSWFDNYIRHIVMPKLVAKGVVNPTKTPVFLIKNLGLAQDASSLSIYALGYHDVIVSGTGLNTQLQTYIVSDFGGGGLAYVPTDIEVLSHELGEWVNDPFINNETPKIQLARGVCVSTLTEVGDFLRGSVSTKVAANGYTYHLQEMAFIPWFFGGYSPSINGWYSANGAFTTPFLKAPCVQ